MSFVYDIRNLKDCKDFKSKREDFFRMLRLQAKLNRNYEQATIARQQMEQLGVTPVMQARRSIEDEQKDLMLQQQLAIKNLRNIMSEDEVRRTIHILGDEDIYFLNTEFGRLAPFMQGRVNITSDFFKRVLERFRLYLESTGMTGVPLPLRETTLNSIPGDLLDEWQAWAKETIDPLTGRVTDIEELIRRTAETLNRTVDDIKEEIASQDKMEVEQEEPVSDEPALPETRGTKRKPSVSKQNLLVKRPRTIEESMMKRKIDEIITGVDEEMAKKIKMSPEEPFIPMTKPVIRVPKREREEESLRERLPEKEIKREPNSAAIRGVKRKDNQFVETAASKLAATGRLTLEQARSLARNEIEARQQTYVPPRRGRPRAFLTPITDTMTEPEYIGAQQLQLPTMSSALQQAKEQARQELAQRTEMRAQEIESGQGLFMSPQRTTSEYGAPAVYSRFSHTGGSINGQKMSFTKKDRRVLTRGGKLLGKSGAGIQANDELKTFDRYKQLGRYMLHVPSLSKSMINIKYPSMVSIPGIPQKFVSQDFIELIWKLVDEGVFEKPLFNRLEQEEQDYFKFLARKCTFDQTIGMGVGKSQTKQEIEEAKRFEMLRGTVIAGNNSPEVLTELRKYILKFLNDKRIPKQQGHDLLYEMTCLGV